VIDVARRAETVCIAFVKSATECRSAALEIMRLRRLWSLTLCREAGVAQTPRCLELC